MDRRWFGGIGLLVVLVVGARPTAAGEEAGGEVLWVRDVAEAFRQSADQGKVLMICINARHTHGEKDEPAAKGLREVVYKNPKVVAKSRAFVCAFLTRGGSSADFGELRARFGIDGTIVSPQHIFARPHHADGEAPLLREPYWSHGHEEAGVEAMLALMDRALEAYRIERGVPDTPPLPTGNAEADAAARASWIGALVGIVRGPDPALRHEALEALVTHDEEGDTTAPLVGLLEGDEALEDVDALVAVVRALGVPGLESATPALHELLDHDDGRLRGNAAVTLEYIGSPASVKPLLSRLRREKDLRILGHVSRALGRCGADDKKARKKLLRRIDPEDDGDVATFGPLIGLAYFEGDAKAARSIERRLEQLGSPFQHGSKAHTVPRALMVWCLAEVGDPESAEFLREEMIEPYEEEEEEEESHWAKRTFAFYEAAARQCEGDAEAAKAVASGIRRYMWGEEARQLVDECRRSRDMSRFQPKGEWGNEPREE